MTRKFKAVLKESFGTSTHKKRKTDLIHVYRGRFEILNVAPFGSVTVWFWSDLSYCHPANIPILHKNTNILSPVFYIFPFGWTQVFQRGIVTTEVIVLNVVRGSHTEFFLTFTSVLTHFHEFLWSFFIFILRRDLCRLLYVQ